ncbi:MAG: sigma 54-interacting transcriptional regulator [Fimbriiglobus sp.]|nr:sigma 54-interacting transcriptional regulator [Fimbriiglobus sp.]
MSTDATGFLVLKRADGFGDVIPLRDALRYTAGRAADCDVVLKDDLCSRRHGELFRSGAGWAVRDLNSMNGCFVNDSRVTGTHPLAGGDVVRFGRTEFLFLDSLDHLPPVADADATVSDDGEGYQITRRADRTKYLPPAPPSPPAGRLSTLDTVGVLYRLAVDTAAARTEEELAGMTLEALLGGTPAEVGAVLAVSDGGEVSSIAHRLRSNGPPTYHQVSNFVTREVLSTRQAVMAENVADEKHLRNRESLTELRATSLICAPVASGDRILGLVHLYATGASGQLTPDDLEFTLAAAKQLAVVWERLRGRVGLTAENESLKQQLRIDTELIGESEPITRVVEQVGLAAGTRATVLIRGESGVGKELVARAIHLNSPRRDRAFICLNCAAITESLLESELFGHEKGAFTGATERMIGKFEAADSGTIFLDEIGEMSGGAQAKLLRVLEGQPFERVGGNLPIRVDVRVVAATNRPLEDAVREGRFRKDLYFRLQVVQIDVPTLRERPDDVPLLANHFLKKIVRETGRKRTGFTPAAVRKLSGHTWPGNVRELRNVVERAVVLGAGPQIDDSDIWLSPLHLEAAPAIRPTYEAMPLEEVEKRHIAATLEHTGWNKSRAAEILGIERSTLDRKIKGYALKK